jgi:hypothetical protein
MNDPSIAANLAAIRERVDEAAVRAGRDPSEVTLIAVSKAQDPAKLADAAATGHVDFGENYVQEYRAKVEQFAHLDVRWHYIGRLQTNKIKYLVRDVHTIHTVDRLQAAREVGKRAVGVGRTCRVLAQVNVGWEDSKGGFEPDSAEDEIGELLTVQGLELAGLMAIPPFLDAEDVRPYFVQLRELRDRLQSSLGHPLPQLSMGMSGDFEVAIEEGATLVRVGTAIFGQRVSRR